MSSLAQVQSHLMAVPYSFTGQTISETVDLANRALQQNFPRNKVLELGYTLDVASIHLERRQEEQGIASYELALRLHPVKFKPSTRLLDECCFNPRIFLAQSHLTAQATADALNASLKRKFANGGARVSHVRMRVDSVNGLDGKKLFSLLAVVSPVVDLSAKESAANHVVAAASSSLDLLTLSSRLVLERAGVYSHANTLQALDVIFEKTCSFPSSADCGFFHAAAAYSPKHSSSKRGIQSFSSGKEYCALASSPTSLGNACQDALRVIRSQNNGAHASIRGVKGMILRNPDQPYSSPVYVAAVTWTKISKRRVQQLSCDDIVVSHGTGLVGAIVALQNQMLETPSKHLKLRGIVLVASGINADPQHQGVWTAIGWGPQTPKGRGHATPSGYKLSAFASSYSFEEARHYLIGQIANVAMSTSALTTTAGGYNQATAHCHFSFVEQLVSDSLLDKSRLAFVSLSVSPPFVD